MFWSKVYRRKFEKLDQLVERHEELIMGYARVDYDTLGEESVPGLQQKFDALQKDHQKLKAIVAELVDYVYKEPKS